MATDPNEARYTALLNADPRVQRAWAAYQADPTKANGTRGAAYQNFMRVVSSVWPEIAAANGINPKDWSGTVTPTGAGATKNSFLDKYGTTIADLSAAGVGGYAALTASPATAGATAATTGGTGSVSAGLGAAATPSELAAGGAGPMAAGSAPTIAGISGSGAGLAGAAGSGGWASWIPQLVNVGAQVGGYLNNRNALKTAQQDQQAATNQALAVQNKAAQTAGNVYQQQRQDMQNLFGGPYQTLGGLMGLSIPSIGPAAGAVPTTEQPTGYPRGLSTMPIQTPIPGTPPVPSDLTPIPIGTLPNGMELPLPGQTTLKDLAKLGSEQARKSSYAGGR